MVAAAASLVGAVSAGARWEGAEGARATERAVGAPVVCGEPGTAVGGQATEAVGAGPAEAAESWARPPALQEAWRVMGALAQGATAGATAAACWGVARGMVRAGTLAGAAGSGEERRGWAEAERATWEAAARARAEGGGFGECLDTRATTQGVEATATAEVAEETA